MKQKIIYLDNAATTFPKPPSVCRETYRCMTQYCGNPGRGAHPVAMESAEKVYECRTLLGDMFGSQPENVCFTLNTTYALNMAIKGLAKPNSHILIGNMDHNSTLRPVYALKSAGVVETEVFEAYSDTDNSTDRILYDIDKRVRKDTKMLICSHSSNICSYTLPIEEIGRYCRDRGIIFIVDAAQSAGHTVIDMKKMNIDILCMPAHKGLYGPQGCGIMILGENAEIPETLIEGGNGVNSLEYTMNDESPERFEAGTVNTPAIAGLCEGIRFLNEYGTENIAMHEKQLWYRTFDYLCRIPEVKIYAPAYSGPVFLFNVKGYTSDDVGTLLSEDGICVRTGYHCSALGHRTLGTANEDFNGAVRVSFGFNNTEKDVDILCKKISEMVR